ncbi:L,D-transpeptidase [Actinomadura atramentaria]|uniref:L,D-transpeptidase n=1 Tax=Actinomadura atramentaria TaxID=1990 RepID=UPI0003664131|nr:L,D-transpeptidase family protein [Actinomadura atramentaria]
MNQNRTRPRARAAALLPAAVLALALGGCGGSGEKGAAAGGGPSTAAPAPTGKVPETTTFAKIAQMPRDTGATDAGDGTVVHPTAPRTVYDGPGGHPVATLPVQELGGPTWVPVVDRSGDWLRVLLPSRPNQASGWISGGDGLTVAHSPYTVKVDTARRTLTLEKSGKGVGTWKVAVGADKTPTPAGRTFVLAQLAPAKKTPSPLVIPLGTHSASLDSFGGGPGTVAFHGWPDASVFGKAVSHGCVRVPDAALRELSRVPLGTVVLVSG